jgi:hypothetical protein
MTKTEILELGRIAGKLEGKTFFDAFQPSMKAHEWCLTFDGIEIAVSILPGEYDPGERILNEIRKQLALVR